ncbi:unnamed protein product [Ectocarpus sp. CCAP 1310/34]|nr:unnamed protein product [Ectocarpus sp. CCAP 1310/34]
MGRSRVDSAAAEKACAAVRNGSMSRYAAAAAFGLSKTSLLRRLSGECDMDARVGHGTVLTKEEENALEDVLLYAGRNYIPLTRNDLKERVRQLCNDDRPIPWDPDKGLGKSWLQGFLRGHDRISLRLARIYEANRMTSPEDDRLHKFYKFWQEFVNEHKPAPDHVWNTDESGRRQSLPRWERGGRGGNRWWSAAGGARFPVGTNPDADTCGGCLGVFEGGLFRDAEQLVSG